MAPERWDRWIGVVKVLIAATAMIVSTVLYVYGADSKASERIAVLETKYDAVQRDLSVMRGQLSDIQSDVKRLLERKP